MMEKAMDLLTRTAAYIDDHHLIRPGTLIVVAFSAGRDSRVLLDILVKLGNAQGFQVVAANFDHQLRPESTEETYFAADIATAYQIPFYSGTADIKALSAGKNLQEVARRERFIFLRHVAAQTGASAIATAHHANDQAETVLLHLLRGAGLSGLSAMNAAENGIIRPLLFDSQQY
ncbi:MAG: tRNA lysidine(34) synthetase TilS [Clostridiales bacterium]